MLADDDVARDPGSPSTVRGAIQDGDRSVGTVAAKTGSGAESDGGPPTGPTFGVGQSAVTVSLKNRRRRHRRTPRGVGPDSGHDRGEPWVSAMTASLNCPSSEDPTMTVPVTLAANSPQTTVLES